MHPVKTGGRERRPSKATSFVIFIWISVSCLIQSERALHKGRVLVQSQKRCSIDSEASLQKVQISLSIIPILTTIMVKSSWDTRHNYYRNMAIAVVHHENDVFNSLAPVPPQTGFAENHPELPVPAQTGRK